MASGDLGFPTVEHLRGLICHHLRKPRQVLAVEGRLHQAALAAPARAFAHDGAVSEEDPGLIVAFDVVSAVDLQQLPYVVRMTNET